MAFEFHVHGLWIMGAVCAFIGSMLAGNIEWVEGTTIFSYWATILIAFAFILFAGVFWISSAHNARQEQR